VKEKMPRSAAIIVLMLGAAALELAALPAASAQTSQSARPPARIRVTPAYPYRTYSTTYPVPYRAEYPGPGYVRQCTSWLATEHRLSGTVLTPQMRCWWQPGG
jgi:hypothetical protein